MAPEVCDDWEEIMEGLATAPQPLKALAPQQVEDYHATGLLGLDSFVRGDWMTKLQDATQEMAEESRTGRGLAAESCLLDQCACASGILDDESEADEGIEYIRIYFIN